MSQWPRARTTGKMPTWTHPGVQQAWKVVRAVAPDRIRKLLPDRASHSTTRAFPEGRGRQS
eukprot:5846365-Pyramimonas_sp.AAC.1